MDHDDKQNTIINDSNMVENNENSTSDNDNQPVNTNQNCNSPMLSKDLCIVNNEHQEDHASSSVSGLQTDSSKSDLQDTESRSTDSPFVEDDFPEDAFIDTDEEKNTTPLPPQDIKPEQKLLEEESVASIPTTIHCEAQNNISENKSKTEYSKEESIPTEDGAGIGMNAGWNSNKEGAAVASGSNSSESVYHVKWVFFKNAQKPIITQNENGPCPLLAIMNVLLLKDCVKLAPHTEFVSANQLMTYLGDCVLSHVPGEEGVSTPSRLNFEQNMGDAMAVMYKLQTGLDVNVKFTGVRDFEYTPEYIIFDLLQIPLYHGWLVDPQNHLDNTAVGKFSYNQLVERIITLKTSEDPELVQQALVAEQFLESSASQLTYHGLSELATQLKCDELAVLFRNNHFTTLYRSKDELLQLVTDQGFLHEANVVWETLSNVEGDCHFVDSNFRTYTKPEPPPLQMEPSSVLLNSEEQIDQDYLVALSLQQEQQQQTWSAPVSNMTDEEFAKQLQLEEEERAAMEDQRGQVSRDPPPANQQQQRRNHGNRRDDRDRDDKGKKSDCCLL